MIEALSPHGKCNQKEAAECVNQWQLGGMRDNHKAEMIKCSEAAGCETNYNKMTQ